MTSSAIKLFSTVLFLSIFAAARPDVATIHVDASKPGARISPTLYGIFFEEINHAGDGGLYGERIRNGSFEDAPNTGWDPYPDLHDSLSTVARVERVRPVNSRNPHYLHVDSLPVEGRRGVMTYGYWGIGLRRGETYHFSAYLRGDSGFKGPITVSLEGEVPQVYASGVIRRITSQWQRYELALRPTGNDRGGRLVISTDSPAKYDLDSVSLFPETWKSRPNGLRRDLAEKLDGMHPAFVRFPGGCFVEGDHLQNAFRWKETIGPVHERKGHLNDNWGYRSSDGLGYHEYLQMCEDLGAEPLFVVNCGMAHKDFVAMNDLDPWVQDALDALEYAIGPSSSKWGAVRAKNGHPKPFRLDYMEIGNENGWGNTLSRYEERYARFYDAIKAKYPDVKLIANVPVKSRPMDIVDDHFYMSPEWFMANADKYDRYDRKGPKVYVGEYAVTTGGPGKGNLRAAVGEAAWMLGMEKNSDVVTMASYAPLFANVDDRRWNPDAICFDSARSYGTPSYHVQTMFAANRPDVNLSTSVTSSTAEVHPTGTIGLGTWRTSAEYKGIRISNNAKVIYAANSFNRDSRGWRPVSGKWTIEDGAYRQNDLSEDRRAMLDLPEPGEAGDYSLELKARKLSGDEGFLIMFHARDRGNFYWWNLGGWGNREHGIEKAEGGGKTQLVEHVRGRIETGRWYDIRIELTGARIRCYLDGKLIHDIMERAPSLFHALAGRVDKTGEIILKAVNAGATPQKTEVTLDGIREIAPKGKVTTLSGQEMDENSLDQPTKVAPVTTTVGGLSTRFKFQFAPHSVTVLRLLPK